MLPIALKIPYGHYFLAIFLQYFVRSEEVTSVKCVMWTNVGLSFCVHYAFNLNEHSIFGFISHIPVLTHYSCLASFRLEVKKI